jgi:hypothetical protein
MRKVYKSGDDDRYLVIENIQTHCNYTWAYKLNETSQLSLTHQVNKSDMETYIRSSGLTRVHLSPISQIKIKL